MTKQTTTTRRTFARIRRFMRGDGLSMAFQPIAELDTGTVVGFESLARFAGEPSRSPDRWFDQAAAAGLRRELEMAAVAAAIGSLEELPRDAYLTVNVSPDVAVTSAFIDVAAPVGPRLVVELTEHAPIDDYDSLNVAIERLRSHGVRIAIDDAGAGFANMTHMLRIEADLIKLDIELTRHIDIDARRTAMVASLVEFARSVGATLVAEGIETEAELDTLRRLGVHAGQGFHLGRPAPLAKPGPESAHRRTRVWRSAANIVSDTATFAFRPRSIPRRRALRAVLALAAVLVLAPATLAIAEDSVPGSPAYWVKRRVEDVRLLVAVGHDARVRLHMQFARRRLNELNRVVTSGDQSATQVIIGNYGEHIAWVERSLPGKHAISTGTDRWLRAELADYVEALDREVVETCSAPGRSTCRPIERAAARSKLTLEKVDKLNGKDAPHPAPPVAPSAPPSSHKLPKQPKPTKH